MKTLKILCFGVIAFTVIYSCQSNQESSKKPSDIIGTFEYTGDLEGLVIWNENHFVWTIKTRMNKPDSIMTWEEKYNTINSAAGTWTMKDSIVTCNYTYNVNPSLVGTTFRWVYDNKGNDLNYRIIDKDGKVISQGSSRRIK